MGKNDKDKKKDKNKANPPAGIDTLEPKMSHRGEKIPNKVYLKELRIALPVYNAVQDCVYIVEQ